MKNIILLFLVTICAVITAQNKKNIDLWSGTYRLELLDKQLEKKTSEQYIKIQKIILEQNENSSSNLSIPDQWLIKTISKKGNGGKVLRSFSFTKEKDEYEQFGWTELHKKGKMKCLDGGRLFICKTTPKTTVTTNGESFFSNSGIFGVLLHHGGFELYRETLPKKNKND